MQQTLLAMLALLITTFLHFNFMQTQVRDDHQIYRAEMEEMATGIAMQTMEVIRARAFDAATVGVPGDEVVDVSEFTSSFTTGNHCKAFGGSDRCNDVDDFHEMQPIISSFETPDISIDFRIEVEVQYLDSSLQPSSSPTNRKEVTIFVQDLHDSQPSFLKNPIEFTETLTYM